MKKRIDYNKSSPATIEALSAFGDHLEKSFPDAKLKVLVDLRVSQINGCAFCIDMHSTQAREQGEKQQRLDCLSAWREVSFFTAKERAAFAWAEAVTLVSQTHVPDDVYKEVTKHFNAKEVVQLTGIIAAMNAWNRFSISFRNEPTKKK